MHIRTTTPVLTSLTSCNFGTSSLGDTSPYCMALRPFPLGNTPLHAVIRRSAREFECVETGIASNAVRSPSTASWVSAESLDSIISLANRTSEEMEVDQLIYRLCRSLYHVAKKKSAQIHCHPNHQERQQQQQQASSSGWRSVECEGHFSNMRGREDWCPLLHLFDPRSYYKVMGQPSQHDGCKLCGDVVGTESSPEGVSQWLMSELSVTRLTGGNSNHVYRLGHASFPKKAVLLRVYGDGGGGDVIDRARDIKVMRLMSKSEMGPGLLHTFHWGRVEEFMDGVLTCTTEKLLTSPSLLADVYGGLSKMHQLDYTPLLPENMRTKGMSNGHNSSQSVSDTVSKSGGGQEGPDGTVGGVNELESTCHTSFERVCLRLLRLVSLNVVEEHRHSLESWLAGEVMFVRRELQYRGIPVVLSHNDLNPGNILLSDGAGETSGTVFSDEELRVENTPLSKRYVTRKGKNMNLVERRGFLFIDFEYADANYRCFDLGNTLCELDYDYTRGTEAGGRGFIKYLFVFPPPAMEEAWRGLGEEYPRMPELIYDAWRRGVCDGSSDIGSVALLAVRRYFAERDNVPLETVELSEAQVGEVLLGMLASHLYWTIWSMTMGSAPDNCVECEDCDDQVFAVGGSGLDYMRYGECRLREYIALRGWLAEKGLLS
ncbi:choline/ethanolamine kinase [Trypanosoma brucei equiperdum]|uniref:Choline/ethanolamine kinase n=1 Tax=Trypanosoma brucei equiperdum TaxID=630700 RepID=A0A3L6L6Z4_9TRYP|nr:choline/ethanolamine kinase [Trypanosoma brucei equiperdum]